MSLNFFKTKSEKTEATLQFQSVVDSLNKEQDPNVLNIDQFIQQENIHLRQHQDFYKGTDNKEKVAPKSISKDDNHNPQDTRILVNSLIELSKSMPDTKSTAVEHNEKVKQALKQNSDTIAQIDTSIKTL